jgi:PIF1-like helicase/Helix-turn-helix domain/Helicase
MMTPDAENIPFRLAQEFVSYSERTLFLTGKAGTGKTTFLRNLREHSFKRMAVVAPTGVAAINAGGVTIHSLFQIPPGLFLPEPIYGWNRTNFAIQTPENLIRNLRLSPQKKQLIEELELLVVDEVSMVRADMIDAIDLVLRHVRKKNRLPFGGVQLLLIGDLFQLPPVVKPEEWELMRSIYHGVFFFDACVFRDTPPVYLELQKIYRQKDQRFIEILNAVRNNHISAAMIDQLHERYDPDFSPPLNEFYITLTTHNNRADLINHQNLAALEGEVQFFDAEVTGDFPEKNFPAEFRISLKPNAQIMFIKNDKGDQRRFFNGKLATISRIDADRNIFVMFDDQPEEMQLELETWRNIKYQYDREKDRIVEEEVGSFKQYPIRLAWAITIHKSQGLTFEKAIIDAGRSFSPGQVYVALSRMTGLDGMVLKSRITHQAIKTEDRVIVFCSEQADTESLTREIEIEKKRFIERTLIDAFDFGNLIALLTPQGYGLFTEYASEDPDIDQWLVKLQDEIAEQQEVAEKFRQQLIHLINASDENSWSIIQERSRAAIQYFQPRIEQWRLKVEDEILQFRNRIRSRKYLDRMKDIQARIIRKQQIIGQCDQIALAITSGLTASETLAIAEKLHRPVIVELMHAEIQPEVKEKKSKRAVDKTMEKKESSARVSLGLFRNGASIEEICNTRELTRSTIMGHLLSFIPTGETKAEELMSGEKFDAIAEVIRRPDFSGLRFAKDQLGEDFSFDEIRAVSLSMKWSGGIVTPSDTETDK